MTINQFAYKNGLTPEAVYCARSAGVLPEYIFHRPERASADSIDESYFIRRQDFKTKVRLFNQSMYYFLHEHFKISELASQISKYYNMNEGYMNQWFYEKLFKLDDKSILSCKISRSDWVVFRFNRKVVIALNKKFGIKFDVEKILDIRMNNA